MVRKVGMGRPAPQPRDESWADYLEEGERLLWKGAPATGTRVTNTGITQSIFGVFFLGFSVFWVGLGANTGGGLTVALFGAPFVMVGLWLVAGHWFYDAYKRKHSRYALTNKRALIARTVFGRKMESYPINRFAPVGLVEGPLDTVNFHQKTVHSKNGDTQINVGFRYIHNGRKVYNILRDIKGGKYE